MPEFSNPYYPEDMDMRLLDLLRQSSESLEKAGIDDAAADAEVITFHAAGIDRLKAYTENPEIGKDLMSAVKRLTKRRAAGEPVQYILGQVDFLGLRIAVGKGVLIPRPETELLVQETIRETEKYSSDHLSPAILDLCTGSGCIALALAKEFPHSSVFASDLSPASMRYARKNSRLNSIGNVTFLKGTLFEPLRKGLQFDLIISNPPYIKTADLQDLQREIREWEPVGALDGGTDGLRFYREILEGAGYYMKSEGIIFMELGYGQADAVKNIAREYGYRDIVTIKDYAGIERIFRAKAP